MKSRKYQTQAAQSRKFAKSKTKWIITDKAQKLASQGQNHQCSDDILQKRKEAKTNYLTERQSEIAPINWVLINRKSLWLRIELIGRLVFPFLLYLCSVISCPCLFNSVSRLRQNAHCARRLVNKTKFIVKAIYVPYLITAVAGPGRAGQGHYRQNAD